MLRLYARILDRLRWEIREWRRPSRASFIQEELDQALLDEIDWQPGERILDVGCAHGVYLRAFQERDLCTTGIDIDFHALRNARGPGRAVAAASGVDLPFADETFDAVVSHKTLHLFASPHAVIREFDRVLRPGGRIVFSGSNTQSPYAKLSAMAIQSRRLTNWGYANRWPPHQWCAAFGSHGYRTRAVYSCNLAWPWVYRICDHWLLPNEWMRRYVKWVRRITGMPLKTRHPHGAATDYVVEIVKPTKSTRRTPSQCAGRASGPLPREHPLQQARTRHLPYVTQTNRNPGDTAPCLTVTGPTPARA